MALGIFTSISPQQRGVLFLGKRQTDARWVFYIIGDVWSSGRSAFCRGKWGKNAGIAHLLWEGMD
ncbi:MAG TPA: hypothetical protein IGS17_19960 [Oscillatoriales cyanobacterium M59_W2019_021]|nr:hypothetical protein [Oscillatoriales cyanobacterium M4454_W2019_049]HIK53168.1 hypothetical protein [Oscillatoriales cyanobacterium M59_W2019_021]